MVLQIIELGLIFSLLVIGAHLTSHIIRFDDLSMEGTFCIGGALTAKLLICGFPLWGVLCMVLFVGALGGILTSIFHTIFHLNNFLAGILTTHMFFSLSLIIASAHLPLVNIPTLFSKFCCLSSFATLVPLLVIIGVVFGLLHWFLKTEIGLLVQVVGINKGLIERLGKKGEIFQGIAISINNMLAALAGSLFVQLMGFFSIWSSIGIIIVSLASLMLAHLFTKKFSVSLLLGGIIYQGIMALAFECNIAPEFHKLITGALILLFVVLSRKTERVPC